MKRLFASSIVLVAAAPGLAQAATVYSGCAVPSLKASHHTFYIDPVHGSQNGDGSAAKPWHTLAEVLNSPSKLLSTMGHNTKTFRNGDTSLSAVNPSGPIKAGDVLVLKSGNHGVVNVLNSFNSDFITVMAAPGETPVVSRLSLVSSAKWLFQGIKFQSEAPAGYTRQDGLVNVGYGDWLGATNNIVFDEDSFSSTDDTSSWSAADWYSKPYPYAFLTASASNCTAITNSHVYNALNGLQQAAPDSIAQGNLIEKMSNDGIDMMASDLLIKGNTIQNGVNSVAADPFHADGIQGWSLSTNGQVNVNKNVVVDSNTILKTGDTKSSYMQGISIFDGKWDNLTISNNIVVDNIYHGIALYGGSNAKIVNNTVLASNPAYSTWIVVNKGKDGVPASNILVRNNICTALQIVSPNVTADHNIAASSVKMINGNGSFTFITKGALGTNKIVPDIVSEFVTLNMGSGSYDLRPRSDSAALAFGVSAQAPLVDIVGRLRAPTVTAGAYN